MRDEQAIKAIKAASCPQNLAQGIEGSGVNEITVDIAVHSLDVILGGPCVYSDHTHGSTNPKDDCHAHWLNADHDYGQQLWSMLCQDFPHNMTGKEYPHAND